MTIGLAEFLRLIGQQNIYAYNEKLLEAIQLGGDDALEGSLALDAGAGRRVHHLRAQVRRARVVIGIDVRHDDLLANQDVTTRVVGNIQRLPFPANAFECIFSVDVVEHLPVPGDFFLEAARCLKPGGALILFTPNLFGYKSIAARLLPRPVMDLTWRRLKGQPTQPHRTYYRSNTLRRIQKLGAAAGLRPDRMCYVDEIPHFFDGHWLLSVLAYLYARSVERLHLDFLLNYTVCVFRKVDVITLGVEQLGAGRAVE